jgi:hypothetical protein
MTATLGVAADVFTAARWLDEMWNSSARATAADQIEWQCRTWGSGAGRCDWLDAATFVAVAAAFELRSWRNDSGRDELVVLVPFDRFAEIAAFIVRLGDEPEQWEWFAEELRGDRDGQITTAAEVLGISVSALAGNDALLTALRIG